MCFKSIRNLKSQIYMHKDPVVFTDESFVFQFYLDGELRFFSFWKGEEGALMLAARDIISRYEGIGTSLKMYRKKIVAWTSKDGTAMQTEAEIEFSWEDIAKLKQYEFIDIVAKQEYYKTAKVMGIFEYARNPLAIIRDMEPRRIQMGPVGSKVIKLKKVA